MAVNKFTSISKEVANNAFKKGHLGSTISNIGSSLNNIVQTGVSNSQIADTSNIETGIDNTQNTTFGGGFDDLDNQFNSLDLSRTNYTADELRGLSAGQMVGNTLSGMLSGASSGASIGGPWGAVAGAGASLLSGLTGIFTGNRKAKEKAAELNRKAEEANQIYLNNYSEGINKIQNKMFNKSLLNIADKGGPLYTHGGVFDNGVIKIQNGGTHEQNPNGGVNFGIDNRGIENVVEEGEVIWNNYVFSNRLTVPKEDLKLFGIKSNKDMTFAEVANKLQKESEERPNDFISNNGKTTNLSNLMVSQEKVRSLDYKNTNKNRFDDGGLTDILNYASNYISPIDDINFDYINFDENQIKPLNKNYEIPLLTNKGKNSGVYITNNGVVSKPIRNNNTSVFSDLLRYAPVINSGLQSFADLIGVTNKPDYTKANIIKDAVNNVHNIDYTPLGDYVRYEPIDKNYLMNTLLSQSGDTRRMIENNAVNRGAALTGLLSNSVNTTAQQGNLLKEINDLNNQNYLQAANFNRGTNQANAELALKTNMANSELNKLRLTGIMDYVNRLTQEDMLTSQNKSTNRDTFINNLSDVDRESYFRDIIRNNPSLLYDEKGRYKASSKDGGYLTIKQNKRRK